MADVISSDQSAIQDYIGVYAPQLIGQMLNGLDIVNDCTLWAGIKSSENLPKITIEEGLQPYVVDATKRGKTERYYTERKLSPNDCMKLMRFRVKELRRIWLQQFIPGRMTDDTTTGHFASDVVPREMEKIASEINDNAYFAVDETDAAEWDSGTTYAPDDYIRYTTNSGETVRWYQCVTATVAGESPETAAAKWEDVSNKVLYDGFGKIIADELVAGSIVANSTGAIALNTAVDQFESMYLSLEERFKSQNMTLYCSFNSWELYYRDFRNKYGEAAGNMLQAGMAMPITSNRVTIKPATWMANSGRLILTPQANMAVGTDMIEDIGSITTDDVLHGVDAMVNFRLGFQVADTETLFVNDQV